MTKFVLVCIAAYSTVKLLLTKGGWGLGRVYTFRIYSKTVLHAHCSYFILKMLIFKTKKKTNRRLKNTQHLNTYSGDAHWRMYMFLISFPIDGARHWKCTSVFPAALCILMRILRMHEFSSYCKAK